MDRLKVTDLNREQLISLKQDYIFMKQDCVSWDEYLHADEIISDEEVKEKFRGVLFTEEDFWLPIR